MISSLSQKAAIIFSGFLVTVNKIKKKKTPYNLHDQASLEREQLGSFFDNLKGTHKNAHEKNNLFWASSCKMINKVVKEKIFVCIRYLNALLGT